MSIVNITKVLGELAAAREFINDMVQEKLLHGSNPSMLVKAQQLDFLSEDTKRLLEGRLADNTSPLQEAKAKLGQFRQEIADALPEEVAHMSLVEGVAFVTAEYNESAELRKEFAQWTGVGIERGALAAVVMSTLRKLVDERDQYKADAHMWREHQHKSCGRIGGCLKVNLRRPNTVCKCDPNAKEDK